MPIVNLALVRYELMNIVKPENTKEACLNILLIFVPLYFYSFEIRSHSLSAFWYDFSYAISMFPAAVVFSWVALPGSFFTNLFGSPDEFEYFGYFITFYCILFVSLIVSYIITKKFHLFIVFSLLLAMSMHGCEANMRIGDL